MESAKGKALSSRRLRASLHSLAAGGTRLRLHALRVSHRFLKNFAV